MRFQLLFFIVSFFFSQSAYAQVTEQTDPLRPSQPDTTKAARDTTVTAADTAKQVKPEDTPIFRYRLTADGTATSGNVNRILLQVASAVDYELSRQFKLSTTPSFVYGRQNAVLNEREFFADFRTTFRHEERLYYLAFGSAERSNLRKILLRYTIAGGLGYKLINRKRAYLSLTNVILWENTDFQERSDVDVWRNSARLFGQYTFGQDRWTLSHTIFYQPALGQPNLRWNGSVTLQVKVTNALSLRSTLFNTYESVVAPGRQRNDLRWTAGVAYEKK
ncbi:hypothetical protein GCM10023189_30700 [Nibrella saemangeumensis]|uniref:DUF481 domain-containing protein n=1 Tax=Nibrella saemangeumensis TaxID=1084526 RepID=A0ABP8MYV6_9BACT